MAEMQRCLALLAPGAPDGAEAAELVRHALGEDADWGALEIEMFPGRDGTLLLARPAAGIYIRSAAVRFLSRRRGEFDSGSS